MRFLAAFACIHFAATLAADHALKSTSTGEALFYWWGVASWIGIAAYTVIALRDRFS